MTHAPENVVTDNETLTLNHMTSSLDHVQLAMLLKLQRDRPLHWHKGVWVLTRYADVKAALRDKRLVNRVPGPNRKDVPLVQTILKMLKGGRGYDKKHWFHYADSPYHADVRKLMREELNRQLPDLRQLFQSIADELLEKIDCDDEQSLQKGFVEPFPAIVAVELMGLPRENWRWFDDLFGRRQGDDLSTSLCRMDSFLRDHLAKRGVLPPGILCALSEGCDADNLLSEEGLLPNSVLFALAAYVNTRQLLERSVEYLLQNRGEMKRIRRDPHVVFCAVEEFARYFSTTSFCSRLSTEDVELGGGVVAEGQCVRIALAAANHDPDVFAAPHRIDLTRHPNPHVAFGSGLHLCVGAAVGRTELQVSLACLARRFR